MTDDEVEYCAECGEPESDEEPQVKVSLVEKEEPKPVMAHGKILDDDGNVIGTF